MSYYTTKSARSAALVQRIHELAAVPGSKRRSIATALNVSPDYVNRVLAGDIRVRGERGLCPECRNVVELPCLRCAMTNQLTPPSCFSNLTGGNHAPRKFS